MQRILIVEDDLVLARIYQELVQKEGWEAALATDGELAVDTLDRTRPDLVLLDLMLPKKNGVEVLRHIRRSSSLQTVPVVVFTNAADSSLVPEAQSAGANKCLIKARTTPKMLIEAVRDSLPATTLFSACSASPLTRETSQPQVSPEGLSPTMQAELYQDLQSRAQSLRILKRKMEGLASGEAPAVLLPYLFQLFRATHALTGSAGLIDAEPLGQISAALEVLLARLHGNPSALNRSSLRTLLQALDCLDRLIAEPPYHAPNGRSLVVLLLDEDASCRSSMAAALERAGLRCVRVRENKLATDLLQENSFDLALLTCSVFREVVEPHQWAAPISQHYPPSPIVFLPTIEEYAQHASFWSRGTSDFLLKPLFLPELVVKALIHVHALHVPRNGE
jgi:DNA-binding response OmpR family regulator